MVAIVQNNEVYSRGEEVRFVGEDKEAHARGIFSFQLFEDVVLAIFFDFLAFAFTWPHHYIS